MDFLANGLPWKEDVSCWYGSLSILFKAKPEVSPSPPLRNTMSVLDRSFKIFSPARCIEHTISHSRRISLIPFVTPLPNGPLMPTHRDCRLAPQTNTSLSSSLWRHSCTPKKTFQEVTHPKIAPHQARLIVEFLENGLQWKEDAPCWYEKSINHF